jgi:hypothetical protein
MRFALALALILPSLPVGAQVFETAAVPLGGPLKLSIDDVPAPTVRVAVSPEQITMTMALARTPRLVLTMPPLGAGSRSAVSGPSELSVRPSDAAGPNHIRLTVQDAGGAVRIETQRRALVEGFDVTRLIEAAGLPVSPFIDDFQRRYEAAARRPGWEREHGSRGTFGAFGLIPADGPSAPNWRVTLAFSWQGNGYDPRRTDRSRSTVVSYRPIVGSGRVGPHDVDADIAFLRGPFCLTDAQAEALGRDARATGSAGLAVAHVALDLDSHWTPLIDTEHTSVTVAQARGPWHVATCANSRIGPQGDTVLVLAESEPTQLGVAHLLYWRR